MKLLNNGFKKSIYLKYCFKKISQKCTINFFAFVSYNGYRDFSSTTNFNQCEYCMEANGH